MKPFLSLSVFFLFCIPAFSQTNVRAWYAQGQVWVIWETQLPLPQTCAVYKRNQSFTNTGQASIIGRPFAFEYLPGTFIQQTGDPTFTYKIPKPDGSIYTLAPGEGLFVETITAPGSAYYAVVEWGQTAVTPGFNITDGAVNYPFDPLNEPVNCHLQLSETLAGGFKANWYSLWLLGRQDENAGRPDFPVMANAPKNGMPTMFIVSEAITMDTTGGKLIPATHWFHGGGGTAIQHVAGKTAHFNINPAKGISVSHTDDFPQLLIFEGDTTFSSGRTQWFGWTRNHNPFDPGFAAGPGDTLVNYTQRRILWINDWLIQNYRVDPDRVALQGYSMGSGGASALGKLHPEKFSTICAFNNGFRRVNEPTSAAILGSVEDNLPTVLRDAAGQVVRLNQVFDLNTPISRSARDLPLFRTWAGKTDINDRMHWGPDLVAQYRLADSLGWGLQIAWDERPHTYETLGYHWIENTTAATQTFRDNLAFQELFNSKQSFPAFFNHRKEPKNNDPGHGIPGIDNGDGDNWGAWGSWHNWDLTDLADESDHWETTAWLTADAPFSNDHSPFNTLTADLAIRKPQVFHPAAGETVTWTVKDADGGEVLQSGTAVVGADSLVVLPQIVVYREDVRRVRIAVSKTVNSVNQTPEMDVLSEIVLAPNPSAGPVVMSVYSDQDTEAEVSLVYPTGGVISFQVQLAAGKNDLPLRVAEQAPAGVYFIQLRATGRRRIARFVRF